MLLEVVVGGLLFENAVWGFCLRLLFEDTVWECCLGMLFEDDV